MVAHVIECVCFGQELGVEDDVQVVAVLLVPSLSGTRRHRGLDHGNEVLVPEGRDIVEHTLYDVSAAPLGSIGVGTQTKKMHEKPGR